MAHITRLNSKGQLTVPASVRRRLGIAPGDQVIVDIEGDHAVLRSVRGTFTASMEGLGKELWAGEGAAVIAAERASWGEE